MIKTCAHVPGWRLPIGKDVNSSKELLMVLVLKKREMVQSRSFGNESSAVFRSFKISSIAASRTVNSGHIHVFYLESRTLKASIFGDEGWVSLDIDLLIPAKRGSPLASMSWVDDGRDQVSIGSVRRYSLFVFP